MDLEIHRDNKSFLRFIFNTFQLIRANEELYVEMLAITLHFSSRDFDFFLRQKYFSEELTFQYREPWAQETKISALRLIKNLSQTIPNEK